MTRNEKAAREALKSLAKDERRLVTREHHDKGRADALHHAIEALLMQYATAHVPAALPCIEDRNNQHDRGEISHTEHLALVASILHQQALADYNEELKHTAPKFYEELQAVVD